MINGLLKDLNANELMNKVKERGEALHTIRLAPDNKEYIISIHFEDWFGEINENTEYYIDCVTEDLNGNQERITTYNEHSHLKDYQVIEKINELINLYK